MASESANGEGVCSLAKDAVGPDDQKVFSATFASNPQRHFGFLFKGVM